jgi:hypothetical protein
MSEAKMDWVSSVTPAEMISAPRPSSEATNSPTIAPVTDIVALSLRPAKM